MSECKIGDRVRAKAEGERAVHGLVVGESREGKCWVVRHAGGVSEYNKVYCKRLGKSEASAVARALRPEWDGIGDI